MKWRRRRIQKRRRRERKVAPSWLDFEDFVARLNSVIGKLTLTRRDL
jgi:hypothetical protein